MGRFVLAEINSREYGALSTRIPVGCYARMEQLQCGIEHRKEVRIEPVYFENLTTRFIYAISAPVPPRRSTAGQVDHIYSNRRGSRSRSISCALPERIACVNARTRRFASAMSLRHSSGERTGSAYSCSFARTFCWP